MIRQFADCPICKQRNMSAVSYMMKVDKVERHHCTECGCIFFNSDNYPEPVYDLKYNLNFYRPGDMRKAGMLAGRIAELAQDDFIAPRILEVGPGNGLTAFLVNQQGLHIEVIDMDWKSCVHIKEKYKLSAWPGRFEECRLAPGYSFIYAGHVIEHCKDPRAFFLKAYSLLAARGKFFLDTPDTMYIGRHHAEWKHFKTRDPYEHCCLFNTKAIRALATLTKFEVLSIKTLKEFESMQVLLRKV